jgi:hypothetical protein
LLIILGEQTLDEIRCALQDIARKSAIVLKATEDEKDATISKRAYFTYLRTVDYMFNTQDNFSYEKDIIRSPAITIPPLSMETIGYLAKHYFLPWKHYSNEDLAFIIFPWMIHNINADTIKHLKISRQFMYSYDNRIAGLIAWGTEQANRELIGMQIREIERRSGMDRRHRFYENERRRFLERKENEEGVKLVDMLRRYAKQQYDLQRSSEFANLLHNQYLSNN